jgi:hypothetical protein
LELVQGQAWSSPVARTLSRGGKEGACRNSGKAGAVVDGCREPLQLELMPLGGTQPARADASAPELECVGTTAPSWINQSFSTGPTLRYPDIELKRLRRPFAAFEICSAQCTDDQRELCKKQCDAGLALSCAVLAERALDGASSAAQAAQARQLLESTCAERQSHACYALAKSYERQGPSAAAQAEQAYQRGCTLGIDRWASLACEMLARRYENGMYGTSKNPALAAEYYGKACDVGYDGCYSFAVMLRTGEGVSKNPARALELFARACALNSHLACVELGRHYARGDGVPRNRSLAIEYLRVGCNDLQRQGCADLKKLGEKVPPALRE